jgi:hypothetical protein
MVSRSVQTNGRFETDGYQRITNVGVYGAAKRRAGGALRCWAAVSLAHNASLREALRLSVELSSRRAACRTFAGAC